MLHIDLLPKHSLPIVKLLVTFSFSFTVKQKVTYMKDPPISDRRHPFLEKMKMWNVILRAQHELNVVPSKSKSDESHVILPKSIYFFFTVQLVGDNTLHFKSFVKSK